MKKLRDLLYEENQAPLLQVDTVMVNIFGPENPKEQDILEHYIMSKADVNRYKKFNLPVDTSVLKQKNSFISDFDDFGDNEKIILNKVMYGNKPLTVIVATIGAGKTSLCMFLKSKIKTATIEDKAPIQAYIDLNQLPLDIRESCDSVKEINEAFCYFFQSELEAIIERAIPNIKDEVIDWWNYAFNIRREHLGPLFRRLHNDMRRFALREEDVTNGLISFSALKEGRLRLRDEIMKHPYDACCYLCELISHLRVREYGNYRWGVTLYIDNLDRSSAIAQTTIRNTLLLLVKFADVRSILCMRVSTWRMSVNNAFTDTIDYIPHTGPSPIKAVIERLQDAKNNDPGDWGLAFPGGIKGWHSKLDELIRVVERQHSDVAKCMVNLSGHNIRKAFVLAQELIASIEQPADQDHLKDHHLKRMMIAQGMPGHFMWKVNGVVDNMFQVNEIKYTPLVKIRILQVLILAKDSRPINLEKLESIMRLFGHDADTVMHALNDMMLHHKRIVWSESVLKFKGQDEFSAARSSKVYPGTATKGYLDLLSDFDYLREMALDTYVPELILSEKVKPGQDAPAWLLFEALLKFVRWVWETDVAETVHFFEQSDPKDRIEYFDHQHLLVNSFLPDCLNQFERIIDSYQGAKVIELKKELEDIRNLLSLDFRLIAEDTILSKDKYGHAVLRIGVENDSFNMEINLRR
jgi:hypothetical protein